MTFNATATIQSIEKLNDRFFKVLLQDDRNQHIIVNVPIEKELDLEVNGKVSIWGNVSAFNYQSKWYNNLFAQTVVPENKKFILVKKEGEVDKDVSFSILHYGKEPFDETYINEHFPSQPSENKIEVVNEKPKEEVVGEKKFTSSKLRLALENQKKIQENATEYLNLEYWHLQNSITNKRVSVAETKIILSGTTTFFIKLENNPKHTKVFFSEKSTSVEVVSLKTLLDDQST